MDVDDYRLNDGALLALDFAERHEENVYETLKRSRAGRWFVENDRMDAFDFVADIDASDLAPSRRGKLRRAIEHERCVGDAERPEPGREDMSETIEIREGEGFDLEATGRYLRAHVDDVPEGELEVRQFPSGASNLTYLLEGRGLGGRPAPSAARPGPTEGPRHGPRVGHPGQAQRRLPTRPETVLLLRGRVRHRGSLLRDGTKKGDRARRLIPDGVEQDELVPWDLTHPRRHARRTARS